MGSVVLTAIVFAAAGGALAWVQTLPQRRGLRAGQHPSQRPAHRENNCRQYHRAHTIPPASLAGL